MVPLGNMLQPSVVNGVIAYPCLAWQSRQQKSVNSMEYFFIGRAYGSLLYDSNQSVVKMYQSIRDRAIV